MTLQAAGQNVAVGVKAVHKKVWVEFGGKWYVAPKSTTSKAIGVPSRARARARTLPRPRA